MNYQALDEALAFLNGDSYQDGYIYESLQDEFNLDLMLLEAEQELFSNIQLESSDIEVLNEGIKETIMGYVQKVIQGIQKAWDKFINLFTQAELKHLKNQVKPVIKSSKDISFTINNFKEMDLDRFNDIKVQPFEYEKMKEHLKSVNDYYKQYYSQLDIANSKNIKEAIEKYVGKKIVEKYKCEKNELESIYKFVAEDYFEYRDMIKDDINALNQSSENIKNMVNQVVSAETPVNNNESFILDIDSESTLLEDFTYLLNEEDEPKMSVSDDDGNTTKLDNSEDAKKENEARTNASKSVTTYMSASTKILSAKMSILNKQKREFNMILNHFYASKKVNDTAVTAKKKLGEIRTDNAAKVNTRIGKK